MADMPCWSYEAMESVLHDVSAALWRALSDNYGVPQPEGDPENDCGHPTLRVKDPTTGHTFIITARPE